MKMCLQCDGEITDALRTSKKYCSALCASRFRRAKAGTAYLDYMRKYYAEHRTYFKRHNTRYYAAHRTTEKARATSYQRAHPERARAINRKAKQRYRQTEKGKSAAIRSSHARRAQGKGRIDWKAWERKRDRIGSCALCGKGGKLTLDHIIPIKKGGTNDIRNLQPLCLTCNCSKGVTILAGSQLILL